MNEAELKTKFLSFFEEFVKSNPSLTGSLIEPQFVYVADGTKKQVLLVFQPGNKLQAEYDVGRLSQVFIERFPGIVFTSKKLPPPPEEEKPRESGPGGRLARAQKSEERIFAQWLVKGYGFDNFIVDGSNKVAYDACRRIALNPGARRETLLIHSQPALGKTHVVSAVANHVLETVDGVTLFFYKANEFGDDIKKAFGEKRFTAYKNRLKKADYVIFDDVQYLFTAPQNFVLSTFFEILDIRTSTDSPLVTIMTADRKISDCRLKIDKPDQGLQNHFEMIEEQEGVFATPHARFTTRIQSGHVITITSPSLKVKEKYLLRLLESEGHTLVHNDLDIVRRLVRMVPDDFRAIGTLNNDIFRAVYNNNISEALQIVLAQKLSEKGKQAGETDIAEIANDITERVAEVFGVAPHLIFEKRAGRTVDERILKSRAIVLYVLNNTYELSYSRLQEILKVPRSTINLTLKKYDKILENENDTVLLEKVMKNLRINNG